MTWLRRGAYALGVLSVGALVALLVVRVVSNVQHANKVTDQRDTLIHTLQDTIATVITGLTTIDGELAGIKHPSKRIVRLRKQVEQLQVRVQPTPTATATATATVTRTARPRVTVTARPPCHGVKVNGGCVPTHAPTAIPTLHLG